MAKAAPVERRPDDFYATPSWCVRRLLEKYHPTGMNWLEPGAGDGAIIRAANEYLLDEGSPLPQWTSIELREEERPKLATLSQVFIGPFLDEPNILGDLQFNVALGNPPFSLAQEFIERSLRHADQVCLLLRLNFLASEKRSSFMRAFPPDIYVLPNRPSFAHGRTDQTEYAWFAWDRSLQRDRGHLVVLNSTSRAERSLR